MYYWLLFLFLAGCASQDQKARKQNIRGDYIFRMHDEYFFHPPLPRALKREPYPWEKKYIGGQARITKEFFRCRGNPLNPVKIQQEEGKEPIKHFDCQGGCKHGLPLHQDEEFIYPRLIEILNYIQERTGNHVVITCGHRCPKHNTYADPSPSNWSSKHMIGAEVDFYVEGWENQPEKVIPLIKQYYEETFPDKKDFQTFNRFEKGGLNVSTPPWYNQEVFIKLYLPHEGRDSDNSHPYPYLGIQLRTDRDGNKVLFDPKQAQNYLRH